MRSDSILIQNTGDNSPFTVCIPGWATDYKVFGGMDLQTNRLLPLAPVSQSVYDDLAGCIRANGLAPVTLMGWSLGGFIAVDFAGRFPELVRSLILCGVRRRYPVEQIEAARRGVLDDRERFLTSFYRQCFLPAQKDDYRWFRDELVPCYLEEMSQDYLLTTLNHLAQVEMNADTLPVHPICMIHGSQDMVAPVAEVMAIAEGADNVQIHVLPDAGHAAFLTAEARNIIQRCLRQS